MKIFIYVCESAYGGLHGIEDYTVEEFDEDFLRSNFKEGLNDSFDYYIWDNWIQEMGQDLIQSYEDLDEEDTEIEGYWIKIKDNIELTIQELNKIACQLGPHYFIDEYCEN